MDCLGSDSRGQHQRQKAGAIKYYEPAYRFANHSMTGRKRPQENSLAREPDELHGNGFKQGHSTPGWIAQRQAIRDIPHQEQDPESPHHTRANRAR